MPDKRLYWDSSTFIKLISNLQSPQAIDDRWHCERFFDEVMRGNAIILTSTIAIVEVLRMEVEPSQAAPPIPSEVRKKIEDLFREPYITLVHFEPARAEEARDLRWQFPWLRTPDAIHIASAIFAKVDVIHTFDGSGGTPHRMIELNGRVGNPPLRIEVPRYQGQVKHIFT